MQDKVKSWRAGKRLAAGAYYCTRPKLVPGHVHDYCFENGKDGKNGTDGTIGGRTDRMGPACGGPSFGLAFVFH